MSFAGLTQSNENLLKLLDSKAFTEADDVTKLHLSYCLLNSKYGLGSFGGFGRVEKLQKTQLKRINTKDNDRSK